MRIFIAACGGLIAFTAVIVLAYIVIRELFFTRPAKETKKQAFGILPAALGVFLALLSAFSVAAILRFPGNLQQIFSPGAFTGSILSFLSPLKIQWFLSLAGFLSAAEAFYLYYEKSSDAAMVFLLSPFIFTAIADWTLSFGTAAVLFAVIFARKERPVLASVCTAAACLFVPWAATVPLLLTSYKKPFKFCLPAAAGITALNLFFCDIAFHLPYAKISAWFIQGNIEGILTLLFFLLFFLLFGTLLYTAKDRLSLWENIYLWVITALFLVTSKFGPECLIFLFPLFSPIRKERYTVICAAFCGLFAACSGLFVLF